MVLDIAGILQNDVACTEFGLEIKLNPHMMPLSALPFEEKGRRGGELLAQQS